MILSCVSLFPKVMDASSSVTSLTSFRSCPTVGLSVVPLCVNKHATFSKCGVSSAHAFLLSSFLLARVPRLLPSSASGIRFQTMRIFVRGMFR